MKPSELLEAGYDVYVSWHDRVQWGKNKCERDAYTRWIASVVKQPKRLFFGAYKDDKLVAFMLPFACDGVVSLSFIASHSESLDLNPNDVLYHALLSISRQTVGVNMAEFGPVSSKASLDKFKRGYGKVLELPSFTWINPAIRPFLMNRIRTHYPWLQGSRAEAVASGAENAS